jgi:hypothetical protein
MTASHVTHRGRDPGAVGGAGEKAVPERHFITAAYYAQYNIIY